MKNSFIVNDRPETNLRTADFFYRLPEELIAQHPVEKRDHSRLMVLDRNEKTIEHKHFFDILHIRLDFSCGILYNDKNGTL